MTDHPEGVPLKTVTIKYSQKYHQNLRLSDVGFKTISCLVKFLKDDLVILEDRVFHKIHFPQKKTQECHRPAALKTLESVASRSSENPLGLVSGSPTSSCTPETQPFTGCKPKEQATQQPRILEVSPISKCTEQTTYLLFLLSFKTKKKTLVKKANCMIHLLFYKPYVKFKFQVQVQRGNQWGWETVSKHNLSLFIKPILDIQHATMMRRIYGKS